MSSDKNNQVLQYVHGGDIYSDNQQLFIDFSANINPLGLPHGVKKAIIDNIDIYTNYPDPICRELTKAICDYYLDIKQISLLPSNIVCGNGAADLIFRLVLSQRPKKAMVLSPTFAEYESALNLVDCDIVYHRLNENNGFCLDDTILADIQNEPNLNIVFVCNPNNPTGIPANSDLILRIANQCKKNNTLLVVDECFCEFLDNEQDYSIIDRLALYDNVVVLKAFTKLYAMAGIRLGYMLSSNCNINQSVMGTLQPWSVSTVAIKCGVAALQEHDYVCETKRLTRINREYLLSELKKLSPYINVFESAANYIFFKSEDTKLADKLKQQKILIRSCGNYVGLDNRYYRIAVKSAEHNQHLIKCIKEIMNVVK